MFRTRSQRWMFAGVPAVLVAAAAVAFAAAGDYDQAFGIGGIVRDVGADSDAMATVVQADGKIVVGGRMIAAGSNGWHLRRYDTSGALDGTFGTGGALSIVFSTSNSSMIMDLALDSSGRILAAGPAYVPVTTGTGKKATTAIVRRAYVARVLANGALDGSFGTGGKVELGFPGTTLGDARAVLVQPDGKIAIAGFTLIPVGSTWQTAIYVARLNANGTPDTTFGSGGIRINDLTTGDDNVYARAIALQSDGKIVLGGSAGSGSSMWTITRYLANGAVDTAFGALTSPGDLLHGLAVDSTNRIVAVGTRQYATNVSDMVAIRYLQGGGLDTSFGSAGVRVVAGGTGITRSSSYPGVAFQSDGKIVFPGVIYPNAPTSNESEAVTVRLNADGSLDATYGIGGLTAPFSLGATNTFLAGIGIDLYGRIVVAGRLAYPVFPNANDWFVVRYAAN